MRESHPKQLSLVPLSIDHEHAKELDAVSRVLDTHPNLAELVTQDLVPTGRSSTMGARGMTGDQVLRVALLKQMKGWSYEDLAFHLLDSLTYQRFCRIGVGASVPRRATLADNVKLIRQATWEAIHRQLVVAAREAKVEDGRKVRVDCTVVKSTIHAPTDGGLVWDVVRVVCREMGRVQKDVTGLVFRDQARKSKLLAYEIHYGRDPEKRKADYTRLIAVGIEVLDQAQAALPTIRTAAVDENRTSRRRLARSLATLERVVPLGWQVLEQTHARVVDGVTVPAPEKIVSIFESHTDVIVKDRRETLFGHKICLAAGASTFITDVVVLDGNPADATLVDPMLSRHARLYGKAPRQIALDGGFASKDNLASAKAAGVKDVCFSKRRGMAIADMAKSTWVYRQLKRFRAGVEGCISFLKRGFGLDRCTWKGEASFAAYVWASVVASNLLVMARRLVE